MASIRKRGGRYHAQVRKSGHPSITQTFSSLTTAKHWATATEADMERNLYVAPAEDTLGELLDRNEKEASPLHKSHEIEACRLKTLKKHLGNQRVSTLTSTVIAKYRDERLKTVSLASLKRELVILSSALTTAIKEWGFNIDNPVSKVSIPKFNNARDRRLEAGEEEKLLTASGQLKRIIILETQNGGRVCLTQNNKAR